MIILKNIILLGMNNTEKIAQRHSRSRIWNIHAAAAAVEDGGAVRLWRCTSFVRAVEGDDSTPPCVTTGKGGNAVRLRRRRPEKGETSFDPTMCDGGERRGGGGRSGEGGRLCRVLGLKK
ncbi:hypothetical protein R6Q59_031497 [Mikania micrantha]